MRSLGAKSKRHVVSAFVLVAGVLATVCSIGFLILGWLPGERFGERGTNRGVIELRIVSGLVHPDTHMAFSPDGQKLALPKTLDGRVELLTLETGKIDVLPSPFQGERVLAANIAFSKDGRLLAVEYPLRGIGLWGVDDKRQLVHIPMSPSEWVVDMVFTDDSQALVAVFGGRGDGKEELGVFRWNHTSAQLDAASGRRQGTVVFDPALVFKALSSNGRWAVMQSNRTRAGKVPMTGDEIGQDLYDVTSGKRLFAVDCGGDYIFCGRQLNPCGISMGSTLRLGDPLRKESQTLCHGT